MENTMTTRQQLEWEVADLRDEIARIEDLDIITSISDDGTRVTETDPKDALPGLVIRLYEAQEKLRRQTAKDAYLLASGG
jgi:hypothetical protein